MDSCVTYKQIRNDKEIITYVEKSDEALKSIGYTEHSFAHVEKVATNASWLLEKLGYSEHECDLAKIAGFMHDIGNIINRIDHAQSGAMMAFRLLDHMNMPAEDISTIVSAIGNHDESTAQPINPISAALIIADKCDVRRSRVRNTELIKFDIHDRVNYAVEKAELILSDDKKTLMLDVVIDTEISSVLEYFEIFLQRMLLCKRAAEFLKLEFRMTVNGTNVL
ncbi:MAG: HD domain-containing protein [Oscillospiraceae bacterium]|nr:HD domain-containing protein [Oscillospiraceae bacterium]